MGLKESYAKGAYLECILESESININDLQDEEKKIVANSYFMEGRIEEAKYLYEHILEKGIRADILNNLARIEIIKKEYEKAKDTLLAGIWRCSAGDRFRYNWEERRLVDKK